MSILAHDCRDYRMLNYCARCISELSQLREQNRFSGEFGDGEGPRGSSSKPLVVEQRSNDSASSESPSLALRAPTSVLFIGPHSGGKTTLANVVASRYGLPLLTEVVRGVLASRETTLERLSADLDAMNDFQRTVYETQLAEDQKRRGGPPFVSDRGPDNLCYAVLQAEWGVASELLQDPRTKEYMESLRSASVFLVEPREELLTRDGTRHHVDWPTVLRVDGMVRMLMHQHCVPYTPISALLLSERLQVVDAVLAGRLPRVGSQEVQK